MKNLVKHFVLVLFALFVTASPLFAQSAPNYGPGIGGGVGMGLSVIGIGIGLGLIGYALLSGMARQPEQSGALFRNAFIFGALVEGAGIIALILCLVVANG